MSEELKEFQTTPTLTLNPFGEEEKAQRSAGRKAE